MLECVGAGTDPGISAAKPLTVPPLNQRLAPLRMHLPSRTAAPILTGVGNNGICSMGTVWVVVKIMVPFWIPIIIRHLIFRVP